MTLSLGTALFLTSCPEGGGGGPGNQQDPSKSNKWDQMKWDQGKWGLLEGKKLIREVVS